MILPFQPLPSRPARCRLPRRPESFPFTVLLAATLLAVPAAAQEIVSAEGIVVRKLPGLPQGSSHGYAEIAFLVTNRSDRPHKVTLVLPDVPSGWSGSLHRLSNEAILEPGASARLSLFQPALPVAGFNLRAFVDGRLLPDAVELVLNHPGEATLYSPTTGMAQEGRRVLVSQSIDIDRFPELEGVVLQRAETGADAWSESWLAYSGFDGIVLGRTDLDVISTGIKSALVRYVETGGSLAVGGTSELPAWMEVEPHATAVEGRLGVAYRGFGVCLLLPGGIGELHPDSIKRLEESWAHTRAAWSLVRNPAVVHRLFPVIASLQVPVRGLFLVIFAFTVLIGPVNVFLLTHRRRRIHLLWTVPAAALFTSLVVFAYAWLGEGMLELRSSAGLTVLDQEGRRAVSLAWNGYYATLTPSDGLRFDRETEVSPVLDWNQLAGNGSSRSLRWGDAQHFDAGWVTARLPAYFVTRKSELRRERLRVRPGAGDSLEVSNGLGARIEALYLADGLRQVYATQGPIGAGASGTLRRNGEVATGLPQSLRGLFRAELPSRLQTAKNQPQTLLGPDTYIAVLSTNPFLEPGLAEADEKDVTAVVYGFLPRFMEVAEAP